MQKSYICGACAAQFPPSEEPPESCPICLDERQFVPASGQTWTTMDQVSKRYANQYRQYEPGLMGVGTVPQFCIGQRALLVRTPEGNILWDCVTLLDDATVEIVKGLGGLAGIAISHPHYYTTMADWSHAFGEAPIYLHEDDRQWVTRPNANIQFWRGDTKKIATGLTLIRCGGHFAGGTVLHWKDGAAGKGALLSGDIVQVVPDRRYVSFMYSYPNYIPLGAASVERIVNSVEPFEWDRIYGAFPRMTVESNGKEALHRSAERYLKAIQGHVG